ncbi:MAG TPA: DUF748 domain-containing protein [Candidatus Udaeobacter sp.]|nr:DUF748 domain-containing protein [Candidatus Udaeobacter sp.]
MDYRPSRRLIFLSLAVCSLVAGFIFILPEVVRRVAVNRLQMIFTVPVTIDDVDVNIFTGRASVNRLVIGNDESRPILTLPAVTMDFSRTALLKGEFNLKRIVVQNPQVLLERLAPNNYNILTAVRIPKQLKGTTPGGPTFTIDQLEVAGGEIEFIDHLQDPDYKVTFSSLEMSAGPISSLPDASITPTAFTLGLKIAGGTLKLSGSTTPFRDALNTQMRADIANVELQAFQVYLPYGSRLNLDRSLLNGEGRYVLGYRDGEMVKHSVTGRLNLEGMALLSAPTSQPIMKVSALKAENIHIDLLESQTEIGSLAIGKPYLLVERNSSGLNLQQFLPQSKTANEGSEREQRDGTRMPLTVKQTEANGATIEFIDHTVSPAVKTVLQEINLEANNMTVLPTFSVDQIAADALLGKGSLRVTGAIYNEPLKAQFSIVGERISFEPYRGYLNHLFSTASSSGESINGKLELALAAEHNGELTTSISGHLEGYNMALEFPDRPDHFLVTKRLGVRLKTIRLGSKPRVDIDQIAFSGANLKVVRNQGGTLELTRLWAGDKQQESKQRQKQTQGEGTILAIRSINVEKSSIEILDRSVSPNYRTGLSQVNATLSDFMPSAKRAELTLQGILGESANLELRGWFTPFTEKPHIQLRGTIRSYALPPLSPYATQYVSHRIREGQITTDVNYRLKGDEIQAQAQLVLRDVRVGQRTGGEFTNRIGIPLELAIALLQDIHGVIRLQLAVSGDTGPQLNIANLIWSAVRNAIIRTITAPFRLVGRILTFGDRIGRVQIDPILFLSGTREIETQSVKQLADLTELLKEKPQLELKLSGNATQAERDTIKREKFWESLRTVEGKNYEEALIRLYQDLGGITEPRLPLAPRAEESLERFVLERIVISQEELRALAQDRAEIVKDELEKRGIDPQRLIVSGETALAANQATVTIELAS